MKFIVRENTGNVLVTASLEDAEKEIGTSFDDREVSSYQVIFENSVTFKDASDIGNLDPDFIKEVIINLR